MKSKLSGIDVIVPVFNEEEMVDIFYDRIKNVPLKMKLIFIDNASTDNTLKKLRNLKDITIIEHSTNEGYGGSIIDGIKQSSADVIVIIDADCEYPPESIPQMIEKLETQEVVYGSRFLDNRDVNMPKIRVVGNRLISLLFNLLFRQKVNDLYTGMKALKRSSLEGITLHQKGFEHVLEMGVRLSQKGISIYEVPIEYVPRWAGRSKMKHISETLIFLYRLLYYRFFN